MSYIICLRKFKIHISSVWTLKWSTLGDFLISSGGDGNILIWGPVFESKIFFSGNRQKVEKEIFLNWSCLTSAKTYYFRGTFRKIGVCPNFNQFCIGTFFGKILLCSVSFFKNSKLISIRENLILDNFTAEVKSCEFSKDGSALSISTRNKILWIWEKNQSIRFQCSVVLYNHESDVKETTWHPQFKCLTSSSYDGFFRFFQKKKYETILIKSKFFKNSSIWGICFDENGDQISFCSGKGEFYMLSHDSPLFQKNKIIIKKKCSFFFASFSRNPLISISYSITNSLLLLSGQEENLELIKNSRIWIRKKKKKKNYGSSRKNFWMGVDKSVVRSHYGSIYNCIWNPKNEKIFASSGEDGYIRIWSFTNS